MTPPARTATVSGISPLIAPPLAAHEELAPLTQQVKLVHMHVPSALAGQKAPTVHARDVDDLAWPVLPIIGDQVVIPHVDGTPGNRTLVVIGRQFNEDRLGLIVKAPGGGPVDPQSLERLGFEHVQ